MNYSEMIEKALKGRSVNSMAKAWGLPQPTLDRYIKGERMPDWNTGLKIAQEAGVDPKVAFELFAAEERNHKARSIRVQMGNVKEGALAAIGAVALVVTLFLTPEKAEACTYSLPLTSNQHRLYIM